MGIAIPCRVTVELIKMINVVVNIFIYFALQEGGYWYLKKMRT